MSPEGKLSHENPQVDDGIKVVDAQFWTNWLADYVAGAVERREAAASRLITALSWFWTVYTATAVLGVTLGQSKLDGWSVPVGPEPDRHAVGGISVRALDVEPDRR